MLELRSVMVGSMQVQRMAEFYAKVFARPADMVEGGNEYIWKLGASYFLVGEHSEMGGQSKEPGRIMCNFETEQIKQEFERIKALGATVIQEPYAIDELWVGTFADPDGNYFQLMTPIE